jgi:hypothetical protein
MLTMLIVIHQPELRSSKGWAFFGFALVFSIILTYPSNAFILLAVPMVQVWSFWRGRGGINLLGQFLRLQIFYLIGIIFAIVAYLYIPNFFGIDEISFISRRGTPYTQRVGLSLYGMFNNILGITGAGIFRFHPSMLLIFLISIVLLHVKSMRTWSKPVAVIYFFCIAFLLQCVFLNDYPIKKLTFLLPFVLLLSAALMEHWPGDEAHAGISGWLSRYRIIVIFIVCFYVLIQMVFYYRLSASQTDLVLQSSFVGFISFILLIFLILVARNACFCSRIWRSVLVLAMLSPGLSNIYLHVIRQPTYFHRDFMISLNKYGDARFIGAKSMGFRLYNSIDAVVNHYQYREISQVVHKFASNDPRTNYAVCNRQFNSLYEHLGFEQIDGTVMRYPDGTIDEYFIYAESR